MCLGYAVKNERRAGYLALFCIFVALKLDEMKRILLLAVAIAALCSCQKMSVPTGKYSRTAEGVVEVLEINPGGEFSFYNTDKNGNIDGRARFGKYSVAGGEIDFCGNVTFKSEYYSTRDGQISHWHNYTILSGKITGSILTLRVADEYAERWGLFSETKYEDKGTKGLTFSKVN